MLVLKRSFAWGACPLVLRGTGGCQLAMFTSPSKLCQDRLRYDLLNIIQPPIDKGLHIQRRLKVYKNTFQLVVRNLESPVKADNLYVLLYSRYFTTRAMLQDEELEDDEALKGKFRELVLQTFVSVHEFENAYLDVILKLKRPAMAAPYTELTRRLLATSSPSLTAIADATTASATLSPHELECFYAATMETDVFFTKNLKADASKFISKKERALEILRDYQFLNGWISAAGVSSFTIIAPAVATVMMALTWWLS